MLKLQTNERNDVFFARRDAQKLTCLTAKFQEEAIESLRGCRCFAADVMQTSFLQVSQIIMFTMT